MKGVLAKRAIACGISLLLSVACIPTMAFASSEGFTGSQVSDGGSGTASDNAIDVADSSTSAGSGGVQSTGQTDSSDLELEFLLACRAFQAVNDSAQDALSPDASDSGTDAYAAERTSREGAIQIAGIEDFKNIANNLNATFELTQDIDFSGYTQLSSCIVLGTFAGKLYGNGHTISNLWGCSLFENLSGATIEGVNFESMNNLKDDPGEGKKVDRACILTVMSNNSTFKDLKFDDANIAGHDFCGVVTGGDSNSTFEKITVNGMNTVYRGGIESGLFAGTLDGSTLRDIHVTGSFTTSGKQSGMLAGKMNGGSAQNVLVWTNMTVEYAEGGATNSAFVGGVEVSAPRIHDCVILGELTSNSTNFTYAFAPADDSLLGSIYDIRISDGLNADKIVENETSSLIGSAIKTFNYDADVQANDTAARGFYRGLGFSGSVWDYDSPASSFKIRHFFNPPCTITSTVDYADERLTFNVVGNSTDLVLTHPDGSTQELSNPVDLTAYLNNSSWDHTFTVSCLYADPNGGTLMAEYTAKVPRRASVPVVASTSQPGSSGAKGKIVLQSDGSYDIRNADDSAAQWKTVDVSGDRSIEVDPGRYQIRTHYYFGKYFASQPVEATVKPFDAPSEDVRYKVTLNTNGGTVNSGIIADYEAGVGAQLPTDVVRSGYAFAGWFSDPNFADGTQVTSISMSDSGDKEFWAKWVSTSTRVSFVKVFGVTAQTDGTGYTVTIPTKPESAAVLERNTEVSLSDPGATYEWRILSGWDNVGVGVTVTLGVTAADGITTQDYPLTIYFADQGTSTPDPSKTFNISYLCYGGSIEAGQVNTYTSGVATTLPTDVKRENYTFMGWYDNPQFTGSPIAVLDEQASGNKVFHAKWLSSRIGFVSVKVDGHLASSDGRGAMVVLPVGSTLPTDPSKIEMTLVPGATAGELTTSDGGATWTFDCTAEDGITKGNCQIQVSIAKTQDEADMSDVMAATSTIFNELTLMKDSPDLHGVTKKDDLEAWIDECIAGLGLPDGVTIEREVVQFVSAVNGTVSRPQGVNGYYKYSIVVSKDHSVSEVEGESGVNPANASEDASTGAQGDETIVRGLVASAHPISTSVKAGYVLDDEGAAGVGDADDAAAGAAGTGTANEGIVVLAASDAIPVTTTDDLKKQENPKKLVFEGDIQALPYGYEPPLRDVVKVTGDSNTQLPKTGDGGMIDAAAILFLIASVAACGAAFALRRNSKSKIR